MDLDLNPTCVSSPQFKAVTVAVTVVTAHRLYITLTLQNSLILNRQREVLSQSDNNDDKMDSFDHFLTEDKVKTISYYL